MMRSSLTFKLFTVGFGLVLSGCSALMHKDPEVKTEATTEYPEVMNDTAPPDEMMMGDEDKPMMKAKMIRPSNIYESEEVWNAHLPIGTDRIDPAFQFVTPDELLPNVLIIGNSISIRYTQIVRVLLVGVANVYRIPDNAGDTRNALANLDFWLGTIQWDIIHFNFGLHDLKRMVDGKMNTKGSLNVPINQYQSNLELIVQQLLATNAVLIWATTSVVPEGAIGRISGDEEAYNAAALIVLERHPDVQIDDQFKLTSNHITEQQPANVHFFSEGYLRIGNQAAKIIKQALADM